MSPRGPEEHREGPEEHQEATRIANLSPGERFLERKSMTKEAKRRRATKKQHKNLQDAVGPANF